MKIQISSAEALQRLIGGDSTLEIELRGAVALELVKTHFKDVMTPSMIEAAISGSKDMLVRAVEEAVQKFMTMDDIQKYIDFAVNKVIDDGLESRVRAKVEEALKRIQLR